MSDRCFNTLQEQNNKNKHYYNFVKIIASPRIRTQGNSIPVANTNHSPKSLGSIDEHNIRYNSSIRLTVSLSTLFQSNTWEWPLGVTVETGVEMSRSLDTLASTASVFHEASLCPPLLFSISRTAKKIFSWRRVIHKFKSAL